jgi:5-methylcytosine-specific restriction enzyme subunit McrC
MSPEPLQLFEYTQTDIPRDFSRREVVAIERFNRYIKQRDRLSTNVLEIVYSDGEPRSIKTSSFVGVVKIGKRTIQILPKILKYIDQNDPNPDSHPQRFVIRNLLYMLSFVKRLPLTEVDVAALRRTDDNFFEVFIFLFAKNLLTLITRSLDKNYVDHEEDVTFLKGKIKFKEHIIRNAVLKHRFFAQFDEFSEDNMLNQILKYTTHIMLNVSTSFSNLRLLQQIAFVLDGISFKKVVLSDFARVHLTRLNKEFGPVLSLAELFISHSSVELSVDTLSTFSLVFDMNVLFERFIGEFIRREFDTDYKAITLQGPAKRFVENKIVNNEAVGPVFQMRPDIVLDSVGPPPQRLIIDTKYKLLEGQDKKEGVSQPDLYQMHAYSKKYGCANVVMLYPQFESSAKCFDFYIDEESIVHVRTVKLCRDLRLNKQDLRKELEDVLHVASTCLAAS